jgi:hypothetical protein
MLPVFALLLPLTVTCFAVAPLPPLIGFGAAVQAQTPADKLPEAAGKEVVVRVCTSCHDSAPITDPPRTVAGWDDTLYAMKDFGAMATDEEWKTISDYLVAQLALLEVNKAAAAHIQLVFDVSDAVAAEVVAYRDMQGGFTTIDDLKKAPGLDAGKIDTLKERLLFR